MNVDMITTFLNDFSTFWKNIGKFLEPIFKLANPEGWTKLKGLEGEERKAAHLQNLNEINKVFGGKGYTPAEKAADNAAAGSTAK